VDAVISGSAEEKGPLFGRSARAGAASATYWTAATTLPAPLAVPGAPLWPSGVLAPLVGPSQPTTVRTIHVNAPLTTTRVGQLRLQARLKRLGFLFIQICSCFQSLLAFENPGARF
jgi:hypothetical protein